MDSAANGRIQRILALLALGICDALQNKVISINEAEDLLFSPHTLRRCQVMEALPKLVGIIREGTELDAIDRILTSDKFHEILTKMMQESRSFLRETEPSDPQLEKWIDGLQA